MTQRMGRRGFLQVGAATAAGLGLAAGTEAEEQPPMAAGSGGRTRARGARRRFDGRGRLRRRAGRRGGGDRGGPLRCQRAADREPRAAGRHLDDRSLVLDHRRRQQAGGMMGQIVQRLDARSELFGETPWNRQGSMPYDAEQMKLVLEQMCLEAGVKVRLHTRVVSRREGRPPRDALHHGVQIRPRSVRGQVVYRLHRRRRPGGAGGLRIRLWPARPTAPVQPARTASAKRSRSAC